MIRLTRQSPTVYTYSAQDGDVTARMVRTTENGTWGIGTWLWSVDAFGQPLDSGAAGFRDARASVIATLETILPLFPA